jgi:hypothetical protein
MEHATRLRDPFPHRGWWIFIAAVLAAATIFYFLAWPGLRYNPTRTPAVPVAPIPGGGTPTGNLVQAGEPSNDWLVNLDPRTAGARAGSPVLLLATGVKQLAGPGAFWIGPVLPTGAQDHPEHWILAVRSSGTGYANMPVQPGMEIRIAGQLEKTPVHAAQLWQLNRVSSGRLAPDEIYLRADNIQRVTHRP